MEGQCFVQTLVSLKLALVCHRTAELPDLGRAQLRNTNPFRARPPHLAQGQKQVLQDAIGLSPDVFLSLHLEIWGRAELFDS